MKANNEDMLETLGHWMDLVFDNEQEFMQKFCKDAWTLTNISWDCSNIRYVYIIDTGRHISDSRKISEWFDFMKGLEQNETTKEN
jgi:hypothetical protein